MPKMIRDEEVEPGDIVLNFCDPDFAHDSNEQKTQTQSGHLIRLLAYALYAKRIFAPGRYFLEKGPFFDAVRLAPELLEEGILIPDLRKGVSSFQELVAIRNLDSGALGQALFLDDHAKHISVFDDEGQSTRFHTRILEDLSPGGALWNLIPSESHQRLHLVSERFEPEPGSREVFSKLSSEVLPELRDLFERWAAIRYYTTPMEFDEVRVRDLPHSAARLLARARSLSLLHFEDPTILNELPDPMSEAAQRMAIAMPNAADENDSRLLVQAILLTRSEIPEARQKLSTVIAASHAAELAGALNQTLRDSLRKERIFADLSPSLKSELRHGASDATANTLIDLVLGTLMGPFAAGVNFIRGMIEPVIDSRKRRESAPWKMSYEHLSYHLEEPKRGI